MIFSIASLLKIRFSAPAKRVENAIFNLTFKDSTLGFAQAANLTLVAIAVFRPLLCNILFHSTSLENPIFGTYRAG